MILDNGWVVVARGRLVFIVRSSLATDNPKHLKEMVHQTFDQAFYEPIL